MSNDKSTRANIAGRIAGAAVAGAILVAGPAAAIAMAGTAAADPGHTTNVNGVEYTDAEIAANLNKNLPGPGFFSLNPFLKDSITNGIIKDFFH